MAKYQVRLHLYSRLLKQKHNDPSWIGPLSRSRFFNTLEEAEYFAMTKSHRWSQRSDDCAFKYYIVKAGETVQESGNDIETLV